jgi:predicted phosphodiesterase
MQVQVAPVKPVAFASQPVSARASQPSTTPSASLTPRDQFTATPPKGTVPDVRLFFFSDNHSNPDLLDDLRWKTQIERPDLVIDGGDWVHDGTEPEIQRAMRTRAAFSVPVHVVTGNHDAHLRGPFKEPLPQIPPFQSFDSKGVHFVLLDNEDETLSEEQFQQLEADLKANSGKPTFVSMHVPAKLSKEPLSVKLGKHLPLDFASPVMRDQAQVKRFHQLMTQYQVKAVLSGHTHFPDEVVEDGVRYLTVGSSGGLSPKPGLDKEYLDIRLKGEQLDVQRVTLAEGKGVVGYAGEALKFYRSLNNFNHAELGWKDDFYPSANVGYQAGFRRVVTDKGVSIAATAGVQAERLLGDKGKGAVFATLGVSAGTGDNWDMGIQTSVGYKHAVYGDYNKGVYLKGAGTANAGYLHGSASAGVGVQAGIGVQYQNFTVELGQEWSTNYQAQQLTVGFRF